LLPEGIDLAHGAALFAAECLMRSSLDGDDLTAAEATIVDTAKRLGLLPEEAPCG
jgi:hypothetical protein